MPLTIPAETLRRSFSLCEAFVPKRTTDNNFKYIRLAIKPEYLEMLATDGQSSIAHRITEVPVNGSSGNLMLPAARFGQVLQENICESFVLGGTDGELIVTGCGEYRLQTISSKDAPKFELPTGAPLAAVTVSAAALQQMLILTVLATDPDSTRYVLGCVRLESSKSELTGVATDSRRLSIAVANCSSRGDSQLEFHLPAADAKRIVSATSGLADSADVVLSRFGTNQLTIALGNSLIVCGETAGKFPTWQKVIPKDSKSPISLPIWKFASIIRQAKICMEEGESGIKLRFKANTLQAYAGAVKVEKKDLLNSGGSKIELPIAYDGPEALMCFAPEYLTQWLSKLDQASTVEWHMTNCDSAVLMVAGSAKYVAMPLSQDGI